MKATQSNELFIHIFVIMSQVVKFSKTFELMSPLCNIDRDIR